MNIYAAIIGFIVLVLGGGYFAMQSSGDAMKKEEMMVKEEMVKDEMMKKDEAMQDDSMMKDEAMPKDEMTKKEDAMMEKDTMQKDTMMKDEGAMMNKDEVMVIQGTIETYSSDKLALAQKGKVLLFFHASWCPICRQLDAEAAANPNIVPDGVHILKVDYDTATALKQKYGVTVQHTFVQVDATGAQIQKFSDASKYASVFSRVK